jgi:hemin uptake protein HemP
MIPKIKKTDNELIKSELKLEKNDLPIVIELYDNKKYILKLTHNGKLILNKKE